MMMLRRHRCRYLLKGCEGRVRSEDVTLSLDKGFCDMNELVLCLSFSAGSDVWNGERSLGSGDEGTQVGTTSSIYISLNPPSCGC